MSFLFGSSSSISNTPISLQSSLDSGQTSVENALASILSGSGTAGQLVSALFPQYSGAVAAPVSEATTEGITTASTAIPGLTTAAQGVGSSQGISDASLFGQLTSQPQD